MCFVYKNYNKIQNNNDETNTGPSVLVRHNLQYKHVFLHPSDRHLIINDIVIICIYAKSGSALKKK